MSFLEVNGYTVPVADGQITETTAEPLQPRRLFSGKYRRNSNRMPRTWEVKTTPLSATEAEALHGWLTWRGQYWPYDSDLFSKRGLPAQAGSIAYLLHGTAADGWPVSPHAKFGGSFTGGGVTTGPAATNLLTANQASPNATGIGAMAFATGMAGVYDATTCMIVGKTGTLKITCSGTDGARAVGSTSAVAATAGTQYTFSVYVRGNGSTGTVYLGLRWSGGTVTTSTPVALSTTQWQRLTVTGTAPAGTTNVLCQFLEGTIDSTVSFWADALMLQSGTPGNYAWVAGGSTRTAGSLQYTVAQDFALANSFTVMGWVGKPPLLSGSYCPFTLTQTSTNNGFELSVSSSGQALINASVRTNASAFTALAQSSASAVSWGSADFGHIAYIVRLGGTHEIWWNGTRIATGTNTTHIDPKLIDEFEVGATFGTFAPYCASIDEVLVLPYAASQNLIQGIYNRTSALSAMPLFSCEGTFCPDSPLNCVISGVQIDRVAHRGSGTWDTAGAIVSFTMMEA